MVALCCILYSFCEIFQKTYVGNRTILVGERMKKEIALMLGVVLLFIALSGCVEETPTEQGISIETVDAQARVSPKGTGPIPQYFIPDGAERIGAIEKIDATEAYALWSKGAVFVDLRHPTFYNYGHIERAVNAPIGAYFEEFERVVGTIDKNKPVVVYCQENRPTYGAVPPEVDIAAEAAVLMIDEGFEEVYALAGNIEAWQEAGYPVSDPYPIPEEWYIEPEEAYELYEAGELALVDGRLPFMYETCHAVGTINVPFEDLAAFKNFFSENFDKNDPIVLFCNSGRGAIMNTKVLRDMGFTNAYCVKGGLVAWKNAGFPIEGNNCAAYPQQLVSLVEEARTGATPTGASP